MTNENANIPRNETHTWLEPGVVLLNDGFPAEGSPQERFYKPGGVYFEACSRGKLLLIEPDGSAFVNPVVMKATEETLQRKAEAKHHSYRPIPVESQRYRFVAMNEIGRLLVERWWDGEFLRIQSARKERDKFGERNGTIFCRLRADFCGLEAESGDFGAYFEGVKSVKKRRFCPLILPFFFPA